MDNGMYRARALGGALGLTENKNEQVAIEFELLDHDDKRMTYYGTFTEKAVQHTLKAMRAAGWTGEDVTDLSSLSRDDVPEVSLVIENEEYPANSGKWSAKVKWVNRPGGLALKNPLVGDQLKSFAARMKGTVLAFDKTGGAPRAKPSNSRTGPLSPEPPPMNETDDIPF